MGQPTIHDAVHYAPHNLVDVKNIGCDFLICSAYKFYGPLGIRRSQFHQTLRYMRSLSGTILILQAAGISVEKKAAANH
jgi:selenocysteine lyase/cysteine desulfurase